MAFAMLNRLLGRADPRDAWRPLYAAVVARARDPHWYRDGQVPDTIDGRFDMLCLIAAFTMLRLETLGDAGAEGAARLTELLVDDMEGQVREIGFGDLVVGKHVGQMVGALGGRLGAYRAGLKDGPGLDEALVRNLYRGTRPSPAALAHVADTIRAFATALSGATADKLRSGWLPQ